MTTERNTPRFSCSNSKMNHLAAHLNLKKSQVVAFDLPAGYTCPAANLCHSRAHKVTGKITDYGQFRCYAAKLEAAFPTVRRFRHNNLMAIARCKTAREIANLLLAALDEKVRVCRIHAAGDFFSQKYFDAWKIVAAERPDVVFFGYTKVLPYLLQERPANLHLAYSIGGLYDSSPDVTSLCTSTVFPTRDAADAAGVPVACPTPTSPDDYDYITRGVSFGLIFH